MEEKILKFLQKNNIVNSHKTFIVGFSGGQDSLCLIDILHKFSQTYNFKIIAAHLNHNWRGEQSKKEQCSCLEYCEQRGIDFYTKTLDMSVKQTEDSARKERYNFFKEICLKTNTDSVFTAHTKTDNTETILYRIIKGTGIHGLCGIPEIRDENGMKILRPMLSATRENTAEYCIKTGLTPSEDSSNFDDKYARNNLRLNIIPLLKTINPNLDDAFENLSEISKNYEESIADFLHHDELTAGVFGSSTDAVKKILIHKFLIKHKLDYSAKRINQIKNFIDDNLQKPCGETLSLGVDKWLFASNKKIEIIAKPQKITTEIRLELNRENHLSEFNKILEIREFKDEPPISFPKETDLKAIINIPKNLLPLELRTRKEGDIIQPFGMSGTMKLKKFFINKGIAKHEREKILLVAHENEILWAIGVGLSQKFKVTQSPMYTIELR